MGGLCEERQELSAVNEEETKKAQRKSHGKRVETFVDIGRRHGADVTLR